MLTQLAAREIERRIGVSNNYDIFEQSRQIISELGVTMHPLATWRDVLAVASTSGYFDGSTLAEVERFLDHPAEWSAQHGGLSEFPAFTV